MALSRVVSEIFNVEKCCHIDIRVRGHSRYRKWYHSIDWSPGRTARHRLSTYGRRAFAVAGPTALNSFPDNLRDPDVTMDNFKRLLKTFLFSAYQCN